MNKISLLSRLWLVALFHLSMDTKCFASQSLWKGTTSSWGTAANWTNGVPTSIAAFGNLGLTNVLLSQNTSLAQLLFDANAQSFTLNTNGKTLTLTTYGITNNSSQQQVIANATNGASIVFTGTSAADGAKITNAANCTVNISGLASPSLTIGSLSGAGGVTLSSKILRVGTLNSPADTISGVISGAGGSLVKIGTGTLTLSGVNTYTGPTTVENGTISIAADNRLGTIAPLILGSATTAGTLLNTAAFSSSRPITLNAGGGAFNTAANLTLTSTIAGPGSLTKLGTAKLILSGLSTYEGETFINAGTLQTSVANILPSARKVTLASGTTLNLANFSQIIGSLQGLGTVTLGSGTLSITDNTDSTFSGSISGTGGLTKTGSGITTLTGNSTYLGATTLNGGQIQIGKHNALPTSSAVAIAAGATLNLADYNQRIASLTGPGLVTLKAGMLSLGYNNSSSAFTGLITGSGGLIKGGTGTLTLSGLNTFSGPVTIENGTVSIITDGNLGNGNSLTFGTAAAPLTKGILQNTAATSLNRSIFLNQGGGSFDTVGGNLTITGTISGPGLLTKSRGNLLIFSGLNDYTGGTTITGGTLKAGSPYTFPSTGTVTLFPGSTLDLGGFNQSIGPLAGTGGSVTLGSADLTVNSSSNTTFSGSISGSGGITKMGTGALTLGAANTYTGPTTLENGSIIIAADNRLGLSTAPLIFGSTIAAGTLQNSAGFTSSRPMTLNAGGGIFRTSGALTLSGLISGPGSLTKQGASTLILTKPNNTYMGGTIINAGTLQMGAVNALPQIGSVFLGAGTTLNLLTFSQSIGGVSGSGNINLVSAALTTGSDNVSSVFSGIISGAGSLVKTGTGVLILSGANTYAGVTTIGNGTLSIGANNNLGAATTSLNLGTAVTAGTLQTTASFSSARPITLNAGGGIIDASVGDLSLTAKISGLGSLTKKGSGSLSLTGANDYTGGTTIEEGIMYVSSNNNLGLASANLSLGSTLTPGTLQTLTALSSSRAILLKQGGGIFDTSGGNLTLTGIITGPGSLTKQGPNLLTLSGMNVYAGITRVNAGTLKAGVSGAFPLNSAFTVMNGSTLDLAGYNQTVGSLAGEGAVTLGGAIVTTGSEGSDTTFSGVISGPGALIKTGGGTFTLSGINTYTGTTTVNAGTLKAGTNGAFSQNSSFTLSEDTTLDLAGYNQAIRSLSGLGSVTLRGATLTSGSDGSDTTLSGIISGPGAFIKTGGGTITLSGINTYAGTTTVNAGTLKAGINGAFSEDSTFTVRGGTTLDLAGFNQSVRSLAGGGSVSLGGAILATGSDGIDSAFSGVIVGPGNLIKIGAGTLTLSGVNAYTAKTTVNTGTLKAGIRGAFSQNSVFSIMNGSTLDLAGYDQTVGSLIGEGLVTLSGATLTTGSDGSDTTFSGIISGLGNLTKTGVGSLTLSGANTYTGVTTIHQGTVLGDTSSLQGPINIGAQGRLLFNQDGTDGSFGEILSGTGSLEKNGLRTLTLSGANTFSGPIQVNAGTLVMNYAQQPTAGIVTINSGGTLMGTGQIYQTVVNNGLLAPGNPFGTSLETLTLTQGYQGSGILQFNIDNQGNSSKIFSNGGAFNLTQTTLNITPLAPIDSLQSYSLIQTPAGAIHGPFQSIPARVGKFVPSVAYELNNVSLSFDLVPTDFAADSSTGNDGNVARYIDQLSKTAEGTLETFIFSLENYTCPERNQIFNQLTPAAPGSMTPSFEFGSLVNTLVQSRMNSLSASGQPMRSPLVSTSYMPVRPKAQPFDMNAKNYTSRPDFPSASTRASLTQNNTLQLPFSKRKGGIWVQGFALNHQQKTVQDYVGFKGHSGGLMTGFDTTVFSPNLYVGTGIGYGKGSVTFKESRGNSHIASYIASLYSLYSTRDYFFDASLAVGLNDYTNNRAIPAITRTALGNYKGTQWTPHLGTGVNFIYNDVTVQPFINMDYIYLKEGSYTERNADFANLSVHSRISSQLIGEGGFNISTTTSFFSGTWTSFFKISYIRIQPLKMKNLTVSFAGQPLTFQTQTLNLKQDEVSPGAGFKINLNNGFYITAQYDAELSSSSQIQEVGLRLGYVF